MASGKNGVGGNRSSLPGSHDALGGTVTPSTQQQWVLNAVNNIRDDVKHANERIDKLHENSSQNSVQTAQMACTLANIEKILTKQTEQLEKLEETVSSIRNKVIGASLVLGLFFSGVAWLCGEQIKSAILETVTVQAQNK